MKIARESWVIAVIGLTDLITTIIFIRNHNAAEANPLFRFFWEMGLPAFIFAKFILLFCPLLVLEWARVRRPRLVMQAQRFSIAAYLGLYCIGVYRLNHSSNHTTEIAHAQEAAHYELVYLPASSPDYIQRRLREIRKDPAYRHPVHRPIPLPDEIAARMHTVR
jgi:uncharacterized membrane protein